MTLPHFDGSPMTATGTRGTTSAMAIYRQSPKLTPHRGPTATTTAPTQTMGKSAEELNGPQSGTRHPSQGHDERVTVTVSKLPR